MSIQWFIQTILKLYTLDVIVPEKWNKMKKARNIYSQISDPEDRQILDAVKALRKETASEFAVASKYEEMTEKEIDIVRLHTKLTEAEEAGLIERRMINRDDEPYISWKPNF